MFLATQHFIETAPHSALQEIILTFLRDVPEAKTVLNQLLHVKRVQVQADCEGLRRDVRSAYFVVRDRVEIMEEEVTFREFGYTMAQYLSRIAALKLRAHPLGELTLIWEALLFLVEFAIFGTEPREVEWDEEDNNQLHGEINVMMLQVCKEEEAAKAGSLKGRAVTFSEFLTNFEGRKELMMDRYKETLIYLLGVVA